MTPLWQNYVEIETVADRPDIELRIVAAPRREPFLAEVLFPGETPVSEAKQYIYQELQEIALRTSAGLLLWDENPAEIILRLGPDCPDADETIQLEDGVQERLSISPLQSEGKGNIAPETISFHFQKEHQWTHEKAREWIRHHLGWHDLGRTALLYRVHRNRNHLTAFLEQMVHRGIAGSHTNGQAASPANGSTSQRAAAVSDSLIEFVSVPNVQENKPAESSIAANKQQPDMVALPAGGAGLEEELSTAKSRNRLPQHLRTMLPAEGFVNLTEAEAIVNRLEELVDDSDVRGLFDSSLDRDICPVLAVLAFYPSQVTLIRTLVQQSSKLKKCGITIEVGMPESFRHRECRIALVGLTRSHRHRAVPYGKSSDSLTLALTRPTNRLIVFGDLGTMARRVQWHGPLEHLDESSAAVEKLWIEQLLHCVQQHHC